MKSEEEELKKRFEELYEKAQKRGIPAHTGFLTPSEQAQLEKLTYLHQGLLLSGGRDEAERKLAFFLPDYLTVEDFDPGAQIAAFEVFAKFGELGHRDVLGSLLGLGITRASVGDIHTEGERAWFYALQTVAPFILQNLERIGRNGVKLKQIALEEVPAATVKEAIDSFTVPSLRVDAVLAAAFPISRMQAQTEITAGNVQKNHSVLEKATKEVAVGDVCSLRGYGKIRIAEIGGKNRKDRTRVQIIRYL